MAEKENKTNKRPQRTPDQFAVNFNAGAAYATATGDILGGMGYVFSRSRDLSSESIIQNVMAGAQAYLTAENEYATKVNKWENSDDENKGDAPKREMIPEMAFAKIHYQELVNSSKMRTELFNNSYDALTINQAKDSTLYGRAAKNVPKEIISIMNTNKDKKVGEVKDHTLKNALDAFKRYHVLGNTAQNIQEMHLQNTLEGLVAANDEELAAAA